jgi:hypothetical protein
VNELFRRTDPDDLTDLDVIDSTTNGAAPAQVQAAHDVDQAIKQCIGLIRTSWIKLAEHLYQFHEQDMWRDLGYTTFEQWLAGPEIDLSRRQVYALMESWRELVVNRGVKPKELEDVPVGKLREVLPAVRRGFVDTDDALADCRTLARDDLRQRYQEVSNTTSRGRAPLDATKEPDRVRCPTCGSRVMREQIGGQA